MVTINNLLKKSQNSPLDSILVLSKLLNVDKSYIFTYGEKEVVDKVAEEFITLMDKRAKGYPIQYILGQREFMGLDFHIEPGVLIPRPDTEVLVEYIIKYINRNFSNKPIKVLDLGCGSGAISLSIANYCKNAIVYGVDISDIGIKVANINKDRFELKNVSFYKGDLFSALEGMDLESRFQIIVSNPPYISSDVIEGLQTEVKDHEPRLALDGGLDGLDFYRIITRESKGFLVDNGLLIYEIGYDQGEAVKDICISHEFKDLQIIKDLQGLDRVVFGYKI